MNPDDPTRPIIGQIFKTFVPTKGKQTHHASICWYYRPEQVSLELVASLNVRLFTPPTKCSMSMRCSRLDNFVTTLLRTLWKEFQFNSTSSISVGGLERGNSIRDGLFVSWVLISFADKQMFVIHVSTTVIITLSELKIGIVVFPK